MKQSDLLKVYGRAGTFSFITDSFDCVVTIFVM